MRLGTLCGQKSANYVGASPESGDGLKDLLLSLGAEGASRRLELTSIALVLSALTSM